MQRRDFLRGLISLGVVTAINPIVDIKPFLSPIKRINFDKLVAITIRQYAPILRDNLMTPNPIFNALKIAGYFNCSEIKVIYEPVIYQES